MQLASSVELERSRETARLPRLKDLDKPGLVKALRKLLAIYRPLLGDSSHFKTLGEITQGRLHQWDAHTTGLQLSSPCLHLLDFDMKESGSWASGKGELDRRNEVKKLLLMPTARIIVFSLMQERELRSTGDLFEQNKLVVVQEAHSVTSPDSDGEELGALLDCSRLRRIHEVLTGLAHRKRQKLQEEAEALSSLIEEAQEYMAT